MGRSFSRFTEELYTETCRKMADEEDRFVRWFSYRQELTDLILREVPAGEKLAVFGAGNCNDIDLNRLRAHFPDITLIDINEKAMRAGLCRYHLEADPGIRLLQADLVGLTETDYKEFIETILQNMPRFTGERFPFAEASIEAIELLRKIYARAKDRLYSVLPPLEKAFDVSCAFGLHSQLNSLMSYFLGKIFISTGNLPSYPDAVGNTIARYSGSIVKEANRIILGASRNISLIGLDMADDLSTDPHAESEGSWQAMQDLLVNYGGKKMDETLFWPFSDKHLYRVNFVKLNTRA